MGRFWYDSWRTGDPCLLSLPPLFQVELHLLVRKLMDNRYELQQLATPIKRGAPYENLCIGAPGQCPTQPQHTTPIWRLTGRFKNSSKTKVRSNFPGPASTTMSSSMPGRLPPRSRRPSSRPRSTWCISFKSSVFFSTLPGQEHSFMGCWKFYSSVCCLLNELLFILYLHRLLRQKY